VSQWTPEFYETPAGRRPVAEYIDALGGREAAAVRRGLRLLGEFGSRLGMPHVRPLERKLWELRVRAGWEHRVLYFAASGRRLILLHAFTKKTQEAPRGEIAIAIGRMGDFQAREGS